MTIGRQLAVRHSRQGLRMGRKDSRAEKICRDHRLGYSGTSKLVNTLKFISIQKKS